MITFEKYASTWEGFIFKSGKIFPSTGLEQLSQHYYGMTSQQFFDHYKVSVDDALLSRGAIYVNDYNIQIGMLGETPTDDQIRLIKEYLEGKGFPAIEVSGVWHDPQTYQLTGEKLLYHGDPENFTSVLNTTISQGYNYNTPAVNYEWLGKKGSTKYYKTEELPPELREEAEKTVLDEWQINNEEGDLVWYYSTMPAKEAFDIAMESLGDEVDWYDAYDMDALIADIKQNGIKVPVVFGPSGIEGYHRLYAAKEAGLVEVPILQYKIIPDEETFSSLKFANDGFIPTSEGYQTPEDIVDSLTYLNYAYNRDISKPEDKFDIESWKRLFGDAVYKYERHYQYELANGKRPMHKRPDWLDRPYEASLKFSDIFEAMNQRVLNEYWSIGDSFLLNGQENEKCTLVDCLPYKEALVKYRSNINTDRPFSPYDNVVILSLSHREELYPWLISDLQHQHKVKSREEYKNWLDKNFPTSEASLKFADILEEMPDPRSENVELLNYKHWGLPIIKYEGWEYALGTDEMANRAAKISILDSPATFATWFLQSHLHGDLSEESIKDIQNSRSADDTIRRLIKDDQEFVDDAVSADGRGNFIGHYDGQERELSDIDLNMEALPKEVLRALHITRSYNGTIYAYRIN